MLNKVMIIGRLGQDPELRYTKAGGVPMTTLNVATDETYTDRDGNKQKTTEWHRVVVFQRLAENCSNYLGKGSLVYVEGSLTTRKWQDQNGQDRYTTEIKARNVQFLDRKGERYGDGCGYDDADRQPRQQWQGQPSRQQSGYDQDDYGYSQGQQPPGQRGQWPESGNMGAPGAQGQNEPWNHGRGNGAPHREARAQPAGQPGEEMGPAFVSQVETAQHPGAAKIQPSEGGGAGMDEVPF